MVDSSTAKEVDLGALIGQLASQPINREALAGLATEVFSRSNGPSRLSSLVGNWSNLELPSEEASAVLKGYAEMLLADPEGAAATLADVRETEWGSHLLVRTLFELRRDAEAVEVAEDAVKKNRSSALVGYTLVEAYCRTGRVGDTGKIMETLSGADGESSDYAWACGLCQEKSGEYREAIESYRLAVDRDGSNCEAAFRLGYLLDLYGTDAEDAEELAIAAYERCLARVPVHSHAVINLGLLYEDRERYHDAAKCFESVLKFHPSHGRARLYLEDAVAATQMFYDKEQEKKADRHSQVLRIPVSDFELSVRSRNCLAKMNIESLGDLILKTEQELLSYKNFGETSLQEIKEMLQQKGLRLGQGLEQTGSESASGRNPLEATASNEILDQPIGELNLSVRSRRCMDRLSVHTVRDLINKTEVELMSAKNFGMTSLNEIQLKLKELGLSLRS